MGTISDMEFNPSKCTFLNITRSKHPYKSTYKLRGQTLETVNDAKYLGDNISSNLSWNKHVNQVTTTVKYQSIKWVIPTGRTSKARSYINVGLGNTNECRLVRTHPMPKALLQPKKSLNL